MDTKAERMAAGLGGLENIEELEHCVTRLRAQVLDVSKADEAALKDAGAHAVVKVGSLVEVVIGADAESVVASIQSVRQRAD